MAARGGEVRRWHDAGLRGIAPLAATPDGGCVDRNDRHRVQFAFRRAAVAFEFLASPWNKRGADHAGAVPRRVAGGILGNALDHGLQYSSETSAAATAGATNGIAAGQRT